MNGRNVLILSSDDWGWKTSKYHLSKRLARDNQVLFISSIGFRSPTASREHMGRILRKLKSFLRGPVEVPEGLYVLTPLVIPFQGFPARKRLNRWLFRLQIWWASRRLGFRPDLVLVFSQNWQPYLELFKTRIAYYCVDEQSAFSDIDEDWFRETDRQVCEQADVIFCSSKRLYETKRQTYPYTYYSPHGVEHALFSRAVFDAQLPVPEDVKTIPSPRLLFFGHLSYDWVDTRLIHHIAKAEPGWQIVLVGRYSLHEAEFAERANIHVVGEREFADLPAYCANADVGLIPFVNSELTRNCNPLKLFEYLSAGLPVVSTDIPEVRQASKQEVFVAGNYDDFVVSCRQAMQSMTPERSIDLSRSMSQFDWDRKVSEIGAVIDGV